VIFFKIFCQLFDKNLGKENSSVNLTIFSNLMKHLPNFQYQKIGKKTMITIHNMIILEKTMVASLVI
jgi:hypothetical protein